jgi:hypothetical protein
VVEVKHLSGKVCMAPATMSSDAITNATQARYELGAADEGENVAAPVSSSISGFSLVVRTSKATSVVSSERCALNARQGGGASTRFVRSTSKVVASPTPVVERPSASEGDETRWAVVGSRLRRFVSLRSLNVRWLRRFVSLRSLSVPKGRSTPEL